MPYPHFMLSEFLAILAPLNEHLADDLTYLSRHILISVAVHDTLGKEPAYLVDKNSKLPVIGFNSGKYEINMVKKYFVKEISYNMEAECNEDVFAGKKENGYMFLNTS